MRCGHYPSPPYHAVSRPDPTAMLTQNWWEASGCGNGVGWTPRPQVFWSSLVAPWRTVWRCNAEKKHRAPFQEQIHCKLRFIIRKTFQIPGDFLSLFGGMNQQFRYGEHDIFFQKRSKRWHGFPPDGMFLDVQSYKRCMFSWFHVHPCLIFGT